MTINGRKNIPGDASAPDAEGLVQTALGYMAAKELFAAMRCGMFAQLVDGPRDVDSLAMVCGLTSRVTRILADAMTSVGLLTRSDGSYSLTSTARTYLIGEKSEYDLAPWLRFVDEISYGHWLHFDESVERGEPVKLDYNGIWDEFLDGVETVNGLHATMLPRIFDYSGFHRMLDWDGLSGVFPYVALHSNPDLTATVCAPKDSLGSFGDYLVEHGVADRTEMRDVDTLDEIPDDLFDLVHVVHVIHRYSPEQNLRTFSRLRRKAAPGARILLLDFFLDDDSIPRKLDSWYAGEYFVIDGTAVYPESDVRGWWEKSGWRFDETRVLPGSPRIMLGTAI